MQNKKELTTKEIFRELSVLVEKRKKIFEEMIDVLEKKGKGKGSSDDGLGSGGLQFIPDNFKLQLAFDYFSNIKTPDQEQESILQEIKVISVLLTMPDATEGIPKNMREILKKATVRKKLDTGADFHIESKKCWEFMKDFVSRLPLPAKEDINKKHKEMSMK